MTPHRPFPSLRISRRGITAQGSFAEAQAAYLEPDTVSVNRLRTLAEACEAGLVAHFYMDPELQGVLQSSGYKHVQISDSLVMADRAVDMVRAGAKRIIVMGVDFMAENVRAVLDGAGFRKIPVYRLAQGPIGCSLAEAAETPEYFSWLTRASQVSPSLHVVYINTSLYSKAEAQRLLPTITCTSSNVVKTVLAAFAQIPDVSLWFGPDTYMGRNLKELFTTMAKLPEEAIARVHPRHTAKSLNELLQRFYFFERGNCIVHHLFGDEIASRVSTEYKECFLTAHLEVPGALFRLALEAQREGRGVVGSTSDILGFVGRTVDAAVEKGAPSLLRFVLGTETGMVTSLVRRIEQALRPETADPIEVEIVFPVSESAVTATDQPNLPIVPGPASGEGCSLEGGCATCPYMKMNHLDALLSLLEALGRNASGLDGFAPKMRSEILAGRPLIDWAVEPINHMRAFSRDGRLPEALLMDVNQRGAARVKS